MPDLTIRTNRLIKELHNEARMSDLREQIELAWKNHSHCHGGWMNTGILAEYWGTFTENTIAYGTLWEVTLHYTNCKMRCTSGCAFGAADLVKNRLECIKRGMPDLHPDVESAIWELAFLNHARFCELGMKDRPGAIRPTWIDPKDGLSGVCNCFEVAKMRYDQQASKTVIAKPVEKIVVGPEDIWYDEQRME